MKYTAFILLSVSLLVSPAVQAQDIPLERCKYLQKRIDYYSKLRKRGGSASQMESWKNARRRYEDEFRAGDCYKYATSLR